MKTRYYKNHLIRWLFSIIGIKPKGIEQLLKELKFSIGEQYENFEFDLKDFGSKSINGLTYEIYLFNKGTVTTLFGLPIDKGILLYFNADILSCVEYRFKGNKLDDLLDRISRYLDIGIIKKNDPYKDFIFTLKDDLLLDLKVSNNTTTHLFLYADYFKKGTQLGIH